MQSRIVTENKRKKAEAAELAAKKAEADLAQIQKDLDKAKKGQNEKTPDDMQQIEKLMQNVRSGTKRYEKHLKETFSARDAFKEKKAECRETFGAGTEDWKSFEDDFDNESFDGMGEFQDSFKTLKNNLDLKNRNDEECTDVKKELDKFKKSVTKMKAELNKKSESDTKDDLASIDQTRNANKTKADKQLPLDIKAAGADFRAQQANYKKNCLDGYYKSVDKMITGFFAQN